MSETTLLPEIRLNGFKEAWKAYELNDLCSLITKQTGFDYSATIKPSLLRDGNENTYSFIQNKDFLGTKINLNTDFYIPKKIAETFPNILIDKPSILISISGKIGNAGLYTLPQKAFIGGAVGICKLTDEADGLVTLYNLLGGAGQRYFQTLIKASSHSNITVEDIRKIKIYLPSSNEEKNKIGTYFSGVDELISLNKAKLEKLINLKKAMLEKMFPKPGADVPEIRFKGFAGAWDKKEVSTLLLERNTQAPKSETYPLMAFVAYTGVAPKGDRYNREFLVSDEENKKYKQTERGDFIYSSNNLETGSIGLNNYGSASISPVYSIFEPTEIADSDFIGRLLVRKSFINEMVRWRQGVVYGQWRIHASDFLKIEVSFPKLHEQRKIGKYFKNLDNLITLHQTELEKLTNIKKACLEKMFV